MKKRRSCGRHGEVLGQGKFFSVYSSTFLLAPLLPNGLLASTFLFCILPRRSLHCCNWHSVSSCGPVFCPFVDAMDGGSQRRLLVAWLQHMIGPLNLPSDPSEEDLRLVLQDGKVFCNLLNRVSGGKSNACIEQTCDSPPSHDRVTVFLSAAADMKLPLFAVADLDKDCYTSSSYKRIVDCLLSLKLLHERKQSKESLNVPSSLFSNSGHHTPSESQLKLNSWSDNKTPKNPFQNRKRWVIPSVESASISVAPDPFFLLEQKSKISGQDTDDQPRPGPSPHQMQQINQRVRDILGLKAQRNSNSAGHLVVNGVENISPHSLSEFVTAVFGNKQHEEVARLVEYMLRKVMEELELCFVSQNQQVTKLKSMLKEHLSRETKLASRATLLEALAVGTEEEVKILSFQLQQIKVDHKKAEEEKMVKEATIENLREEGKRCKILIENLKQELEQVQQLDQEHLRQLELEKNDLEQSLRAKLDERETLLQESNKKVQELEAVVSLQMEAVKRNSEQYQSFVCLQRQSLSQARMVVHTLKEELLVLSNTSQDNLKMLEEELYGMVHAAVGYHKVLAENRLLYNEVQDLKGNIRVYCRVRPFLLGQSTKHTTVEFMGENGDIMISNPLKQQGKEARKVFTFNKVFKASATQEEVFMDTRPLIRSVLDGFNVCIFAYGQTGSGKTYTMSGPSSLSEKDWGVNYRALNDLFQISRNRKDVIRYEVGVQMIEIYNEQVRDLLYIDNSNRRLEIRNNSQLNGVNVPDASMLPVTSTTDVFHLMKIGQRNRAVGATALNERSSRSHSVLTVHVRGTELSSGTVLHGCLHLVDLAGSERVDRSEATGERLKEAQHINRSLSALGDVVSALAQKSSHVPYRNSKLTQLLQDSLGGQAKTLMFVHISSDVESFGETLSTLKFAERVASVELGAAKSNKESRELRDLKEQVALLKEVVSKKDVEIERLHMARGKWSLDKPKDKLPSAFPAQETLLDIQDKKLRRQTMESRVNLEAFESHPQEDFKAASFTPPRVSGSNIGKKMITSAVMPIGTDTSMGQGSHGENYTGGTSTSDLSHTGNRVQVEAGIDGSLRTYPQYRSVIEQDRYLQAMLLREAFEEKLSKNRNHSNGAPMHVQGVVAKGGLNLIGHKFKGEHGRHSKRTIDYSDGETSQAGSEP